MQANGAALSLRGGSWFAERPSRAWLTYVSLQQRDVPCLDEVCVFVVLHSEHRKDAHPPGPWTARLGASAAPGFPPPVSARLRLRESPRTHTSWPTRGWGQGGTEGARLGSALPVERVLRGGDLVGKVGCGDAGCR